MSQSLIFQPVCLMLIMTAVVWATLFVRRIGFLVVHKVNAERYKRAEELASILPAAANMASDNFKNLFEVPVIFYVVCLVAYQLQVVDGLLLNCAWAFVILRALHALIHCTYNRVFHRFMVYAVSSVLAWIMVAKLALAVF